MLIKTRFAPSLSGNLHVGSLKIALINFIFANKNNGEMILRVDDTNKDETKISKEAIIDQLNLFDINNLKVFCQSNRLEIYKKHFENLKAKNLVLIRKENDEDIYYFLASKIARKEKFLQIDDPVYGFKKLNSFQIKDYIIGKNNKFFYNFCSVVDDIELNISHIIRGADHISNSFQQMPLFEALGSTSKKVFCHIPNIFARTLEKLSKKKAFLLNLSISQLIENEIFPETIKQIISGGFDGNLSSIPKSNLIIDFEHFVEKNKQIWKNLTYERVSELTKVKFSKKDWEFLKQVSSKKSELITILKTREDLKTKKLKKDKDILKLIESSKEKTQICEEIRKKLTNVIKGPSLKEYIDFFSKEKIAAIIKI